MSRFTVNNQPFECSHCRTQVPPASSTSRNHCPKCLHSLHVDHFPGDRQNQCRGLMKPVSYDQRRGKGLSILFECLKCRERTWNIALLDDRQMPDDYSKILQLSGQYQA